MITLEGHLERITFYNSDNHFLIGRLRVLGTGSLAAVLGHLPRPNLGELLRLSGNWQNHPRYGDQLRFNRFEVVLPTTSIGIKNYLASGVIKGLGPKTIERLMDHFGAETLSVIEKTPEKLEAVSGIGPTLVARIAGAWNSHHATRRLFKFLEEIGVSSSFGAKLIQQYGPNALDAIQADPFRLVVDFPRNGFYMADAVLRHDGLSFDADDRAKTCIMHLLTQAADDGHTFQYEDALLRSCQNRFHIDESTAQAAINKLCKSREIALSAIDDENNRQAVYLRQLYRAETEIGARLQAMLSLPAVAFDLEIDQITTTVLKKLALKPADEQLEFLKGIIAQRVSIITGGPGTGKTTLIRAVTAIFESIGQRVALTAPTGRAARRLSEVTHHRAATIHKLLGYNGLEDYFAKDMDDPLDTNVVIVDEASMVDTLLLYHLLRAMPLTATLILVGDAFQLPSVGPGNVLGDLIESGAIRTFALSEIFRQAAESLIIVNAHKIRHGEMPPLDTPASGANLAEFGFIEEPNPKKVVDIIQKLCTQTIPKALNLNPVGQIQVLTPMHKGEVGTLNLNQVLQKRLNPQTEGLVAGATQFGLGDKVMHLKNNYIKDIFNGDIGTVSDIDLENKGLTVRYIDKAVDYELQELDELALAYAISVHKSQGSEYPAVVVPLLTQHYPLLQRNLLYTALTRGQHLVIFVGTRKAFEIALHNDRPQQRLSNLRSYI
jgi:exodeoxyribonuclease V alpha subunit